MMLDVEVLLRPGLDGHADDTEEDLRSLLRWIRDDESLNGNIAGGVRGDASEPGHMGLGFDVLQLTLESGMSLGALAVSVLQWRDARAERFRPVVVVRHDDTEVELPVAHGVDPTLLAQVMAPLLAAHAPAAVREPLHPPAPSAPAAPPHAEGRGLASGGPIEGGSSGQGTGASAGGGTGPDDPAA